MKLHLSQLAQNIKLIRQAKNLSQQEFADIIGSSKDQVFSFENDRSTPNEVYVEKIVKYAGVCAEDLRDKKLTLADLKISGTKIPATIGMRPGDDYQKIIRIEATVEVLLDMVAEVLARQMNVPVGPVLAGAKMSIDDQVKLILSESEPPK